MGNVIVNRSINNALNNKNYTLFDNIIKKNNIIVDNNFLLNALLDNDYDFTIYLIKNYNLTLTLNLIEKTLQKGNIGLIIYLLENNHYDLNINDIFVLACKYQLSLIQFIYRNFDIDLNYKYDLAFFNACVSNRIKTVRWLFYRGSNYDLNDDIIFKTVCSKKYLKIITFLKSICERYDFQITSDNEIVPIIEDLTDNLIKNKKWKELIKKSNIKIDNNFNDEECIITFEKANFKTNCNHYYDFLHFIEWYSTKTTCPVCTNRIILNDCKLDDKYLKDLDE